MDEIIEFLEISRQREREEKIERYRQLNSFAKKGQIVFAGSSLAEQFPINEMLQNLDNRHIIYNRGISGDTTDGLLRDIDTCILDLLPSKLFINIGSNDIASETYDEDSLMSNYRKILDIIKERLPNTLIYIMSYYPVNPCKDSYIDAESRKAMFANRNNQTIMSANKRVESMSKEYGYTYIDVSSTLMNDSGNLHEAYTLEGIHMWPVAYTKVLDILQKYF